jgi:hypothetical protein
MSQQPQIVEWFSIDLDFLKDLDWRAVGLAAADALIGVAIAFLVPAIMKANATLGALASTVLVALQQWLAAQMPA